MFVKPVEGREVRDPVTQQPVPPEGREVPDTAFWNRRVRDGDLKDATPPKPSGKAPAAPAAEKTA